MRKPNVLRDNRDLRLLFVAQNLSFMGDWFTFVALAGLVQDVTDSALLVSLLLVAFSLPSFLASPLGGPVADRYDRRQVLIVVSVLQAIAACGLLFIGTTHICLTTERFGKDSAKTGTDGEHHTPARAKEGIGPPQLVGVAREVRHCGLDRRVRAS
ncbi:MAG: MFS transporter [Acidimicrobiia bacterium]|nr:MFS transporter [Acidimicrobiia bacterium]